MAYHRSMWKGVIAVAGADATISSTTRTPSPGWMFPDSGIPSPVATKAGAHDVSTSVSPAPALVRDKKGYKALFFAGGAVSGTRSCHSHHSKRLSGRFVAAPNQMAGDLEGCRRGVVRAGEE